MVNNSDRLQAIKAGFLGAIVFTLVASILLLLQHPPNNFDSLIKITSYLATGFLFGVTYLHLTSNRANMHLKDGAVLAFALVRSLSVVEFLNNNQKYIALLGLIGLENLICFASTRFCLDLALKYGWIAPIND